MMVEEIIELESEISFEAIKSIDFDALGNYIAMTGKGTVHRTHFKLETKRIVGYPIIRIIDEEEFIIVENHGNPGDELGYIYDGQGNILANFDAGYDIKNILIHRDKIIISYGDFSILNGYSPSSEGVAIFDLRGNKLFGFNSKYSNRIEIIDCYCLSKWGSNKILFLPYNKFDLVELNLDDFSIKTYQIPEELKGASHLTSFKENIIFHSTYEDKEGVYIWKVDEKKAQKIGRTNRIYRSLNDRKFLGKDEKSFFYVKY